MRALVAIAILLAARLAHAECPTGQAPASCALHDEAVELFKAGKYDQASTKFRAAIAAGPTSRSYLGYSQSVEEQGKIALAYETMLVAQKLSGEEMAKPGAQADPAIVGRAERIKYKLAELGGKIGYVWLRIPAGVQPARIVSVYREGEGDLASPLGRWIVVAPSRQLMFATLDDGSRVEMVATVAAGGQSTLVIPIAAAPQPGPQIQPPIGAQQPQIGSQQPAVDAPKKPPPLANTIFAVDAAMIARESAGIGFGLGFAAQLERKIVARVAVSGRAAIVFHPSQVRDTGMPLETSATAATEVLFMAGARTRSKLPLYGSLEVGALIFDSTTTLMFPGAPDREVAYAHTYPAVLVGGGVRLGRVHLEIYSLLVGNTGDVDLGPRVFATLGVDLLRR